MKFLIQFLVLICVADSCLGRHMYIWSYEELTAEAELVIVAVPRSSSTSSDQGSSLESWIPGQKLKSSESEPGSGKATKPSNVIWLETTFEILTVLKGGPPGPSVKLLHAKISKQPIADVNGPGFMSFDDKKDKAFLLFLKSEGNLWVPVAGQIDANLSVKEISGLVYPNRKKPNQTVEPTPGDRGGSP